VTADVTELSHIVRMAGEVWRDAKAKRIRTLYIITEQPDGVQVIRSAGDPPLNANAMAIALLETVSHLLSKEAIPDDPPAVDEGSE